MVRFLTGFLMKSTATVAYTKRSLASSRGAMDAEQLQESTLMSSSLKIGSRELPKNVYSSKESEVDKMMMENA